jgi:glycine C-acetyltransferase/8-amino-7-oxononanoate synthase
MEPEPLQQVDRTYVRRAGRKLSYFAGCDYFRLASHPEVQRAIVAGLRKFGGNVAASRLTTGNHILYTQVEAALRQFFGAPAALVVSSGYATNLVVAQALEGEFTHAAIDARAHVGLRDASRFLGCPVFDFQHRDPNDLVRAVKAAGNNARIILLTDGMFSRDGEIAPLPDYLKILPRNGVILLDDAHAAGVLGEQGRGTIELARASRERVIQTITLSKAFGVYGGAILGSRALREKIVARSPMFAGSTPPPLPFMNAALAALRLLRGKSAARRRLNRHTDRVKKALREVGYALPETPSPIISVVPRDARHAGAMRKKLLARGVFPSLINYPGAPARGYFRFVLSSEHSDRQLDSLVHALEECLD